MKMFCKLGAQLECAIHHFKRLVESTFRMHTVSVYNATLSTSLYTLLKAYTCCIKKTHFISILSNEISKGPGQLKSCRKNN